MKNPSDFDPYQPPASADPAAPVPAVEGYLTDTVFIGRAAQTAISLQVLNKIVMAFAPGGREGIIALTISHMVVYLASMVLYLVWLYRTSLNVLRINRHADLKPGWAVGSYFIPFLNWVAPVLTMRTIIRVTFAHRTSGMLPALAVVWWVAFMISNIALRFGRDPLLFGLWGLSLVVSWMGVIVLVTRISRCQAEFPRPDESPRVMMTPLSATRRPSPAPPQVRQIPPPHSESAVDTDIESGWGGG